MGKAGMDESSGGVENGEGMVWIRYVQAEVELCAESRIGPLGDHAHRENARSVA